MIEELIQKILSTNEPKETTTMNNLFTDYNNWLETGDPTSLGKSFLTLCGIGSTEDQENHDIGKVVAEFGEQIANSAVRQFASDLHTSNNN